MTRAWSTPTRDADLLWVGAFGVVFVLGLPLANWTGFLSDYYLNLYVLRYGPRSSYFLNQRISFENQTSMNFDLVYSTGTDRIYAHKGLP